MRILSDAPSRDQFTADDGFPEGVIVVVLTNAGARRYGELMRVTDDSLYLRLAGDELLEIPLRTVIMVGPLNGRMSAWNHAPEGAVRMGMVSEVAGSRISPFVFFMPGYVNTPGWKDATPRPWWA